MSVKKKRTPKKRQLLRAQSKVLLFRRIAAVCFVLIFAAAGAYMTFASYATTAKDEHIITTLYAYPTESSWSQVEKSNPTVKYAIVNICAPDGTGPGCTGKAADAKNPDWVPTIAALKSAGITPLYYISTNYGATAISTLESELQQAINWYGIASPHWDTMQPDGTCNNGGSPISCTTYNNDLYTYALNKGASAVMFNPGTTYGVSTADIFGSKEIIEVFEGTASSFEKTSFPSWMNSYSGDQFVVTLSTGTSATIGTDVADAVKDNIGNIYEDDEAEPPNYATLPSFWNTEVKDVAAYATTTTNTSSPPPTSGSSATSGSGTNTTTPYTSSATTTPHTGASNHTQVSQSNPAASSSMPQTSRGSIAGQGTTTPSISSTARGAQAPAHGPTPNPFIRLRNFLFANYKGSPVVSTLGTLVVLIIPIFVVVFLLRGRIMTFYFRMKSRVR